ncbi:MAG TPA: Holliday junction resolvase RuvX, partial [Chthoniobacterales bacterium]
MSSLQLRRRILGIDLGRVRIGVAVSDELGMLAHPVETIAADTDAARRIAEIVRDKDAERVIVGLPRHMNGSVGIGATEALAFAQKLKALLPCEVLTWDERLTTTAANRALRESGRKARDSRGVVDQVAAQ